MEWPLYLGMPAVVASEAMLRLMELVRRVAQSEAGVLISGESGSGKEVIARALHQYSLRCAKPWVDVNCAALPDHLVESELFGYEKGAFSGADSAKQGLFELAHNGTLFLDEIGELEPKMQVKLLRVLDGVPYYRLGGQRKISVDVRVLAATNRDLSELMREGRFRSDLYHRLNQVHLRVPPLRERPEDILPLAEFFLRQANPDARLAADASSTIVKYGWPGNVRELRNVITAAAVVNAGSEIRAADLPGHLLAPLPAARSLPSDGLDGMEKTMILQVLEQTRGHQRKAAGLLGISPRTLSRKLKLYGVTEDVAALRRI